MSENKPENNIASKKEAPMAHEKTAAAAAVPPLSQEQLLSMMVPQLKEECLKRGLSATGTKDVLLEKLGIPAVQWKKWRNMKVAELKEQCRGRNLPVSGNKEALLTRLGVPQGFGESSSDKFTREMREMNQRRKKKQKLNNDVVTSILAASLIAAAAASASAPHRQTSTEDDPTHMDYTLPCCSTPHFEIRRSEPAGCIFLPDGGLMEVYRCMSCGKIPERPNAPPIQEFSDDEGHDHNERGGGDNNNNDCVIQ